MLREAAGGEAIEIIGGELTGNRQQGHEGLSSFQRRGSSKIAICQNALLLNCIRSLCYGDFIVIF